MTSTRHIPTPSTSTSVSSSNQTISQVQEQLQDAQRAAAATATAANPGTKLKQIAILRERKFLESAHERKISTTSEMSEVDDDISEETKEKLSQLQQELSTFKTTSRRAKPNRQGSGDLFTATSRATAIELPANPSGANLADNSQRPPSTISTAGPRKRPSRVPRNVGNKSDIEFATEIGQGLLIEIRKFQNLLLEKEMQIKQLEISRVDNECDIELLTKQLREREESEAKLKEDRCNLSLANQEYKAKINELQQALNRLTGEHNKLPKQYIAVTEQLEIVEAAEKGKTATFEITKIRHESAIATMRKNYARLQREKAVLKQIETLHGEPETSNAKPHIQHRPGSGNSSDHEEVEVVTINHVTVDTPVIENATASTPPLSLTRSNPNPSQNQLLEVETLKASLGHAHRMISNLRTSIHKERTEKLEMSKLLGESQDTIETLRREANLWEGSNVGNNSRPTLKRQPKFNVPGLSAPVDLGDDDEITTTDEAVSGKEGRKGGDVDEDDNDWELILPMPFSAENKHDST